MLTVGGLLLAAGRSSRMTGGHHKLLAEFEGIPLVRKSALTLLHSQLFPIVAVIGHRAPEIKYRLNDLPLVTLYNKEFAKGLGSSLACGFGDDSLVDCDGVLIMLADMPAITTEHIDALLVAFTACGGHQVVRGADRQKPGHPIVVPNALFHAMQKLEGDEGARAIMHRGGEPIQLVNIGPAALYDVDTVEAVFSAGGIVQA